ncbi:long-chain fatty acid--CoA ligase [Corynebacterium liangguodongii]|uniref:Acyl-CoA synthetase n=1 Tax=Corynebacterium liangguodongii TaxID=2079535 RepID=A0A2S0WH74_9CORY|nr:long-chain fatty acid--CoA ligase [Corynebacterium liangguodongii]PWB98607.1 long-chain fatty acid--CoA ligase [Corynebacterium liangguodongii]
MNTFTTEADFTLQPEENVISDVIGLSESRPDIILFNKPEGSGWVDVTAADFVAEAYELARGIAAQGVEPGDRVVILSESRYEWTLVDFAILAAGAVTVPIYPSSSEHQIQWILEDSGAKLVFVESAEHARAVDNVLKAAGEASSVARVVTFDGGGVEEIKADGSGVDKSEIGNRVAAITHDSLASIVYTSGTTGRPKGVSLTHLNWYHEARALLATSIVGSIGDPVGKHAVTFLPLAHVLQRAVTFTLMIAGATQSHWSDTSTITTEFQRAHPALLLGVPRVFEKVRSAAYNQAADSSEVAKKVFLAAERAAIDYSRAQDTDKGPGLVLTLKNKLFDKLVYSKVKAAMGGEVLVAISGGSAISPDLLHFFRGMGVSIYEGYGLTETTAAACVNDVGNCRIGTVGRPVRGYTVRVSEEGELEIAGDGVAKEYWNNPEATASSMKDGWFSTGDFGEIDNDGFVRITGRKKDLIVTAGGKNVSPGPLEEVLTSNALLSNAIVVGDGRPFVGLLVTIDEDEFKRWKQKNGIAAEKTVADLREDVKLRAAVQEAVDKANQTVSKAEEIKKFRILERDLSEEDDEVTPTMKIKRNVVVDHFSAEIEKLYQR